MKGMKIPSSHPVFFTLQTLPGSRILVEVDELRLMVFIIWVSSAFISFLGAPCTNIS